MNGVVVEHLTHQEVAIKFHVNRGLVFRLIKAYKNNSLFIEELKHKEKNNQEEIDCVIQVATNMHAEDGHIRKLQHV